MQPLEFGFFCNKDLNWYFKPNEHSVKDFVDYKFDILIDLNFEELLAVRFVLAESAAMFKTGRYCTIEPNYYDLMIKLNKNQEAEKLNALIKETERYLLMINP